MQDVAAEMRVNRTTVYRQVGNVDPPAPGDLRSFLAEMIGPVLGPAG